MSTTSLSASSDSTIICTLSNCIDDKDTEVLECHKWTYNDGLKSPNGHNHQCHFKSWYFILIQLINESLFLQLTCNNNWSPTVNTFL